jgi:hypothetical protein
MHRIESHMKFERIQLGIKIGSLGDEARRIRRKEQSVLLQAHRERYKPIMKLKGLDGSERPEALIKELERRIAPAAQRVADTAENPLEALTTAGRIARKTIRKFLRQGLTKEEILALPGVQKSLRHMPVYESLRRHRKGIVRHEARHAQLALSFLRERPYSRTEDKPASYPNWDKVADIAKRFSGEDSRHLMQRFEQWSQEAQSFIRGREIIGRATFTREPARFTG